MDAHPGPYTPVAARSGEAGNGEEPRRVPLHRNPFLWAFLIGIATLTAIRPLLRHIPEPPPVLGEVPSFTLTNQDGQLFTKANLLGRVTIANLFCTGCGAANSDVVKGMRRIEDAYKDRGINRIGFLSISTDPDVDTPEHLRQYARAIGADTARWTFLTGSVSVVDALARDLFKGSSPGAEPEQRQDASPGTAAPAANAKPLLLIDQRGRIRGWYGADEMGLDEVYNRAQHVLAQSAREP